MAKLVRIEIQWRGTTFRYHHRTFAPLCASKCSSAIAEFDGATGNLKKEYIYGASGLVATIEPTAISSNGTRYTTSDHLGSPRVVTNSSAGVVSRHDYMPFDEELFNGGRTTAMGYGVADGQLQKFTSKERDNETGLDWFGSGRYYSSVQGRFTSVDPGGDELRRAIKKHGRQPHEA